MVKVLNIKSATPFSRTQRRDSKLQAILSEAAKLFNVQGTRATTLTDISGRMGVTKTSLYYYARNKQELIYKCYLASCAVNLELMNKAEDISHTGLDCLLNFVRICLGQQDEIDRGEKPHIALLIEVSALSPESGQEITKHIDTLFSTLLSFVVRGVEDKSLSPCNPIPTTQAYLAILNWAYIWYRRVPMDARPAAVEHLLKLIQYGISGSGYKFSDIVFSGPGDHGPLAFDRDARNQVKREAFMQVSSEMFNKKGYVGTSLDEVAEQLDVTKGAFYYHIKDKEDLLYKCFQRTLDLQTSIIERAKKTKENGADKIALVLRSLFNIQHSEEGPMIGYRALPSLDVDHRNEILKLTQQVSDRMGQLIQLGVEDGSIRDIDLAITKNAIYGMIDGAPDVATRMDFDDNAEVAADYCRLIFSGIAS